MRKPLKTLRLSRETVLLLDRASLQEVGGGGPTVHPGCPTQNLSCVLVCP